MNKQFNELIYIPNFDYFVNDKAFLRGFIQEIIKICVTLENETNNKFHFLFEQNNKKGTNSYLLIDYNIISIAFINYYKNNNLYKKLIQLFLKHKNDCDINLLVCLAKIQIIYFSLNSKFYSYYEYYRYTRNDLYIIKFKGIAINYQKIKDLLHNDTILFDLTKVIKNNYNNFIYYKRSTRKKYINYNFFLVEESKVYKDFLKEEVKKC